MSRFVFCLPWGAEISVKQTNENLQALAGKIRRGKSVEQAAEESGVTTSDAHNYLADLRNNQPFDDDSLRLAAAEALSHGLDKLIEIATTAPRVTSHTTQEEDGAMMCVKTESTDLDAAKTLVRFALDARKLIGMKKGAVDPGQPDLFDGGSWKLRD